MNHNRQIAKKVAGAIATTAFASIFTLLPHAAFAQQSPGAYGNPRISEPNTNTRIDDPSRPINPQNRVMDAPNAGSESGNINNPSNSNFGGSNSRGQMNDAGVGGGAGGVSGGQSEAPRPANRLEQFNQPGATDPSRSTEYFPPANSPRESNSNGRMNDQMNNTGVGGGAGGTSNLNRGNDQYTAPNPNMPGTGTYSSPRNQNIQNNTAPSGGSTNFNSGGSSTQNNNSGGSNVGGGAGGTGSVPGLW